MRRAILVTLAFAFAVACQQEDTRQQQRAIRLVVDEFNAAMVQDRFEIAASLLDSTTIAMYEDALAASRVANAEDLQHFNPSRKMLILTLRHKNARSELAAMSPDDCFAQVFKNLATSGISIPSLWKVTVNGDRAYATVQQQSSDPVLYFVLEEGSWKIQFSRLAELLDQQLIIARDNLGVSDEEVIIGLIASTHFHPPNELILEGPLDHRMPTIATDGWAPDYPGPPISLDEPERFADPSPKPTDLQPGQKVELLFRVIEDGETNQYRARREALWVRVTGVRSGLYVGVLLGQSVRRKELSEGKEVLFFQGSVLNIGDEVAWRGYGQSSTA